MNAPVVLSLQDLRDAAAPPLDGGVSFIPITFIELGRLPAFREFGLPSSVQIAQALSRQGPFSVGRYLEMLDTLAIKELRLLRTRVNEGHSGGLRFSALFVIGLQQSEGLYPSPDENLVPVIQRFFGLVVAEAFVRRGWLSVDHDVLTLEDPAPYRHFTLTDRGRVHFRALPDSDFSNIETDLDDALEDPEGSEDQED